MSLVAALPLMPEYPGLEEMYACLLAFLRMASQATDITQVNLAASAALSKLLGIEEG